MEGRIRQELIQCLKQEDFKKNQNLYVFITGDIVNQNGYDANQDIWIEEFVNTLGWIKTGFSGRQGTTI